MKNAVKVNKNPQKMQEKTQKIEKNPQKNKKMQVFLLTKPAKCGKVNPQKAGKHKIMETVNIVLQIPLNEYGQLATLAAAANMPIDQYVLETGVASKMNSK